MSNSQKINLNETLIKKMMEEMRPPTHIRNEIDRGYTFKNSTLKLFEIRPRWDKPDEKMKTDFAKGQFIKNRSIWKIYWMRSNGKWELYEPNPEVKDLKSFFATVKEDKLGCFFG